MELHGAFVPSQQEHAMKPSGRLRTVFCLLLAAALGWALTLALLLVSDRNGVLETVPDLPVRAESSESPPLPTPAEPAPVASEVLDLADVDTFGTNVLPPLTSDVPAPFDLAAAPPTEPAPSPAPDDTTAATPSLPMIVPVSAREEVVLPATPELGAEAMPAATPAPAPPAPAAEESVPAGVPLIPLPAARRKEAAPGPMPEPVQPAPAAPAVEPIVAPSASDSASSAGPTPAVEPQPEPSASREPEAEAAEAAVASDEETAVSSAQPDGAGDGALAASRGEGDAAGATEPAGVACGSKCAGRPGWVGRLWDFLTYRPLRSPGWRNCCKVRSSCCRPPLYYYFLDSGCGAMGCMFWNQPACDTAAVPVVAQ
jgi:hypothetical protein